MAGLQGAQPRVQGPQGRERGPGRRAPRVMPGMHPAWARRAPTPARPLRPAGKTRGMGAGRKLRLHRKEERWADKDYKKSHLGSEWKKPFAGASHAKGIVLEKM